MTDTYPPGYLDLVIQRVPVGRTGQAQELAAALIFLASDAGAYVTGQTIAIDGGMTITRRPRPAARAVPAPGWPPG